MSVNEVRSKYLAFFATRGHAVIPSAPIVPENDPTTLFTSSVMQPLVPYLLGQEHPEGTRLANSQPSLRAGGIEEVGDNRHTNIFEMLGNWWLGDYFKKEQLPWVYEFLTEELNLPKERLWVTCFAGDESLGLPRDLQSAEIWKELGIPEERVHFYDAKKNWWSRSGTPDKMPAGEPGGPDSEIFYEFTSVQHDVAYGEKCHPNCECGRFMEIGNSVFMEYIKLDPSTGSTGSPQAGSGQVAFDKLPKQNVDFGGGLERLAAATLDSPDIFMIDVFDAPREVLEAHYGKKYADPNATRSFRIILDHVRAAKVMFDAHVRPSNTERGYVLRRLIRRAIREVDRLGVKAPILAEIAGGHTAEFAQEEAQFRKTLERGLKKFNWRLDSYIRGTKGERRFESSELPPSIAFELVTTDGFHFELVEEESRARGMTIDKQQFANRMEAHRIKSREGAATKFAGGLADHAEQTVKYHTAHHLLLKALQMVLGPDVHQRGSNITSERLRIDFSYGQKMTDEQKKEVEKIVNEKIAEGIPVIRTDMKREEAEKLGAEHEFGATYPDMVSVYSVGPLDSAFSIEFCGGPHVSNTGELTGTFKIVKEEASSAGVRRIKAVLE